MQCKSPEHSAGLAINDVHLFITWAISTDLERGDQIAELLFETIFWPKYKFSNFRMQAVRANHQVELPLVGMSKLDANAICILLKTDNLVTEKYIRRSLDLFEQEPREVTATKNARSVRRSTH